MSKYGLINRSLSHCFGDLLDYAILADNGIIQMVDGTLVAGFIYAGFDSDNKTATERNLFSIKLAQILAQLGSGWAMHADVVRHKANSYIEAHKCNMPHPVLDHMEKERRLHYVNTADYFDNAYAVTFSWKPPSLGESKASAAFYDSKEKISAARQASKNLDTFKSQLNTLESKLSAILNLRRMLDYQELDDNGNERTYSELCEYITYTISGKRSKIAMPEEGFAYLDMILGSQHYQHGVAPVINYDEYILTIGIKGLPLSTIPQILARIESINVEYRFSSRFIFLDPSEADALVKKHRRKWEGKVYTLAQQIFNRKTKVSDEYALDMTADASEASKEVLASSGYGYYTPIIILRGKDYEQLIEDVNLLEKHLNDLGFEPHLERENTTDAFIGSLPGHVIANIRKPLISALNLANLLPVSATYAGQPFNECQFYPPDSPPVAYVSGTGSAPYRLGLHVGDVGHTLIFGPTGTGKSVLLAFLAWQMQRFPRAQIFSFDKGHSMFALSNVNGTHYDLGEDESIRFAPLQSISDSRSERIWAGEYIETLCKMQGVDVQPRHRESIKKALDLLASPDTPENHRSMSQLVVTVQDHEIREALRYYDTGAGGELLNAETDELSDSRFLCFEIGELMNMGEAVLLPTLLYLFHQIEKRLDGSPSFIILDEAWMTFKHEAFKGRIVEWLKVLRKANCGVILATQSIKDASSTGILDTLTESCRTKILLANPDVMNTTIKPLYHELGLNDSHIATIQGIAPKREYFVMNDYGFRVVNLNISYMDLQFLGVSDKETLKEIRNTIDEFGEDWPTNWLLKNNAISNRSAIA